ncbi:hypothetical protein vBEcoMWL3_gp229 [Escherichia phage vB_EcoM_WL-3]|nr:hypothetical protein vBEcoMWL3_gp229 [Escherichia phage vB_EcoM_WL-3]
MNYFHLNDFCIYYKYKQKFVYEHRTYKICVFLDSIVRFYFRVYRKELSEHQGQA